jgi:hypothetical protein
VWWLTPVIPAVQEEEVGRSWFKASPGEQWEPLSKKQTKNNRSGDVAQVIKQVWGPEFMSQYCHTHTHTHTHTCTHTCVLTCTRAHTGTVHKHTHLHSAHTYTYSYTHVHHTYIHKKEKKTNQSSNCLIFLIIKVIQVHGRKTQNASYKEKVKVTF